MYYAKVKPVGKLTQYSFRFMHGRFRYYRCNRVIFLSELQSLRQEKDNPIYFKSNIQYNEDSNI